LWDQPYEWKMAMDCWFAAEWQFQREEAERQEREDLQKAISEHAARQAGIQGEVTFKPGMPGLPPM
jgi:hypothetical protein